MKRIVLAIVVLAAARVAQAQTAVYDAHGNYVGRYESNGAPLGQNAESGEAAIRLVNGVWLALPVGPKGFVDSASSEVSTSIDKNLVYWTGAGCTGTPYLYAPSESDTLDGFFGNGLPDGPFVQNPVVAGGVAYYYDSSTFPTHNPGHVTICSEGTSSIFEPCPAPATNGTCGGFSNLLPATGFPLSNLGLTPPFSLR